MRAAVSSYVVARACASVLLCGALVLLAPVLGEEPTSAKQLDDWLSAARSLDTQRPRELDGELASLPHSNKLLARVLVEPQTAGAHLSRAFLDSSRPVVERAYAGFLLGQFTQFRSPPCYPRLDQLAQTYEGTSDLLLRWHAYRLLEIGRGEPTREERGQQRWFEMLRNPWTTPERAGDRGTYWRTVTLDRELAREILQVLPTHPRWDNKTRLDGDSWLERFTSFFSWGDKTRNEAIELLLDEYKAASSERRSLFMHTFFSCCVDPRMWREMGPRIVEVARSTLLSETDWTVDLRPALFILEQSGRPEDARAMLAGLARSPDWQAVIKEKVYWMVKRGKWPKSVPLDEVFPQGLPKPEDTGPPKPRFRQRPAELMKHPLPLLEQVQPESWWGKPYWARERK